jgi:hypothetical protein
MLSVADCQRRAHNCMVAAALAPDRDAHFQWQVLADSWLMFAERLDPGESGGNEMAATIAATIAGAIGSGERLREKLDLVK